MPSQPVDTGWDFSSVIDLIGSGSDDIRSPALRPATQHLTSACQDGGVRLGSFSKLFESLGFSDAPAAPLPPLDPESELSNSDEALLPSPTLKPSQTPTECVEVPNTDLPSSPGLTKTQRKKARRRAEKELLEEQTRQRIMQETLDQLAEDRKQRERHLQRKKSDELVSEANDMDAADKPCIPCKPSRTNSRSNVGAKMRPATPVQAPVLEATEASHSQPKPPKTPKTPKARPSVLQRPSATQPETPKPLQAKPLITSSTPALDQVQNETYGTRVPDPCIQSQLQRPRLVATPVSHGLVPRTVRPVTLPRAVSHNDTVARAPTTPTPRGASFSGRRAPLVIRSKTDRHLHLFNKLMEKFPEDQKWLVAPMQLLSERSSEHGIHVFVDASNIMIGLKDMLRQHGLQHNAYDISFDSLALLMERRRPVAKRFFAGSHREANPLRHIEKMVETSKAVGYDSVMQEQVLIVREDSEKKKFFNDVKKMGWHKATRIRSGGSGGSGSGSGSGSDSETGAPAAAAAITTPKAPPAAPKWVEQGVDEIVHLKMCQSILDCEWPSTMVLATGDGAVAEMSDGFLAHVERALKRGWRVELISWGQQINSGYRKRSFRAKWGEQFTIIELDEFLEDLIDTA